MTPVLISLCLAVAQNRALGELIEAERVGKTAALRLIAATGRTETWTPSQARTALSGELGYTWGTYQGAGQGNYLRIWRLRGERWIIVLDITSPVP